MFLCPRNTHCTFSYLALSMSSSVLWFRCESLRSPGFIPVYSNLGLLFLSINDSILPFCLLYNTIFNGRQEGRLPWMTLHFKRPSSVLPLTVLLFMEQAVWKCSGCAHLEPLSSLLGHAPCNQDLQILQLPSQVMLSLLQMPGASCPCSSY